MSTNDFNGISKICIKITYNSVERFGLHIELIVTNVL